MAVMISQPGITEIENQHNVVYRGFSPGENNEYRFDREHTDVNAGWFGGWLYADGTLVVPFSAGCEVFDPAYTAASPEALEDLLRSGDVASEK